MRHMISAPQKPRSGAPSRHLHPISAPEFASRFRHTLEYPDGRFAFFLGAGCSISSGIPSAADLSKRWMRQLHKWRGKPADYEAWASQELPGYTDDDAARFYPIVMDTVFPTAALRQVEIERMIEGHDPGFGYAVLARLMTDARLRGKCNFALTTNFDDLVADAIYLYTRRKPLVITHHSLSPYVGISRTRPLVLKLHGDAWVAPLSTVPELETISADFAAIIEKMAAELGIVFIGYGGNDDGITKALAALDSRTLKWGIYWVNDRVPETAFGEWLVDRGAVWVKHLDFDQLMALLQTELVLDHPDYERFNALRLNYVRTFERLVESVEAQPYSEEKNRLSAALGSATEMSDDWRVWASYARKHKDLTRGRKIFENAITRFPGCAPLLGSYANFLADQAHDPRAADHFYRLALEADGSSVDVLTDYSVFLEETSRPHKARILSEKASQLARNEHS